MDSSDGALRLEIPWSPFNGMDQEFSVFETCGASHIIIQQDGYDRYEEYYSSKHLVIIPETISRLVAVETITINA